jgi:hypothetical protein
MNKLTDKQKEILENLTGNFIDAGSVGYDWSEGYADSWDIIRPDASQFDETEIIEAAELYDIEIADFEHNELIEEIQNEIWLDSQYEPMMNYYTDLGDVSGQDIAQKFNNSCFTVIEFDTGNVGLALTGGGMDMSWSMARAFISAGYLPPEYICQLPKMGGENSALTIAACNETLKILSDRFLRVIEQNNNLIKKY